MKSRKPKLGSIYLRGHIYWIKYYRNGQVFRESSDSEDYGEAERLLKRRQGEIVTGKFAGLGPERLRFRELADQVLADYTDNNRKSRAHVERRLRLHLLPALGDVRAAEFSTAHIRRYIATRKEEGASNATLNRELAIVKRAFHLAAANDPPLVMRIPHIPMLREDNVRKGFLDHETYVKLRNELLPAIRPIFVVAYHTGARIGELRSLRWEQVDLKANRITLFPGTTKNQQGRTLPIYGEMREWLLMQQEIKKLRFPNCDWVFHRGGKPIRDFRKVWAEACKCAGVPGLLFHDLRRTAIRNMIRAGIPERVAMQISGHKTRSVFDRYNIVSDRDIADAGVKMEHHLAGLGTISGTIAQNREGQQAKDAAKSLQ